MAALTAWRAEVMMGNTNIIKLLNAHGVPFYEKDNNIYADSMEAFTPIFEKVINLTGKSKKFILEWLGY